VVGNRFLRNTDGTVTTIQVPGASPPGAGYAWGVNNAGVIVGYYVGPGANHGFLRNADGSRFTDIDAPGALETEPKLKKEGVVRRPAELDDRLSPTKARETTPSARQAGGKGPRLHTIRGVEQEV